LAAKKKTGNRTAAVEYSFPKASKARTKSEVYRAIAEATGVARRDVVKIFGALSAMISQDLNRTGIFTLPGLAKMTIQKKPATKARKGINPFTGQETMFKAKPARKVVKVRPLKQLKSFVA
jgi:nucleoid DNA-binding protein